MLRVTLCVKKVSVSYSGFSALAESPASDWPHFRGDEGLTGVARSRRSKVTSSRCGPSRRKTPSSRPPRSSTAASVRRLTRRNFATLLSLADGEPLWSYRGRRRDQVVAFGSRTTSSTSATRAAIFHAVDAETGKVKWTFATEAGIISSANFVDDRVVFGSYDNFLYSLRAADGFMVWKLETDNYVHASPAVADGFTYFAGCDGLFRRVKLEDGTEVGSVQLQGYVAGSAAVLGKRAFVGSFENEVLAINLDGDPSILWRYQHSDRDFPFYSSPAVTEREVIIGGRDKLVHAIDAKTGKSRWTFSTKAQDRLLSGHLRQPGLHRLQRRRYPGPRSRVRRRRLAL